MKKNIKGIMIFNQSEDGFKESEIKGTEVIVKVEEYCDSKYIVNVNGTVLSNDNNELLDIMMLIDVEVENDESIDDYARNIDTMMFFGQTIDKLISLI